MSDAPPSAARLIEDLGVKPRSSRSGAGTVPIDRSPMRLRILGESAITIGGKDYTPSGQHFFALLLRLGVDAGRYYQRHEVASLFFPQAPTASAALHSARQLIYQAAARGAPIVRVNGAVALDPSCVSIDFEEAILEDQASVGSRYRPVGVLPGYAPSISDELDEWLESYRAQQQARFRHALVEAISVLRRRADWRGVEARARECLSLDPLSEPATLALAEALAHTGSKELAVATLDAYRVEVARRNIDIAMPAALLRKRIASGPLRDRPPMETAFVGRGAEISALHRQWQRARDGNLEYTLIRGEPGSGKTRLMEEFHGLVSLSGGSNIMFVRRAASEPFRPYALFAELASHLMRMPGAAGCNPELLPFLTRLTRATFARETDPTTPDETAFISTGIKRAIVDLIESVSGEKPCLILLDDSRAIDDVSLGLLRELPALAPTLRVHLAITCDTLDSREDMLLPSSATLSLTPLCAEASQELLTGLLAKMDRRLDTETFEWCVRVAAGNPAFLSLLGAHAAESPGLPDVPVDIIEVVDKRIAGLSPIVVRVLAACAVLGDDDCTSHLLECVLAIEPLALLGALHELEHGGLIAYSDERIHLRSALFRDRVLQSTGGSVLSLLHGRCAAAMEAEPASAGCDWRIASHWRRAGQHNRARATLMNSWRASLQLGQPKQAVASLREYLSLTTDTVERVTLHDGLIELTQAMRDGQATVQAIDERQKLVCAAQLNDPRREALSFDRLDAVFHDDGDQSAYASELVAFMNSRELDTHRRLSASLELMICADAKVDPVLADMVLKKLLVPDESDQRARHTYHSIKLIFHSVFGDKSEALRLSRELISSTASDFGHWPDARARFRASMAILLTGDARAATDLLEACYARFASAGALSTCVAISGRLANFYFDEGDLDHAREWERRAAAHVAEDVERILPCEYLSVRADLALVAGDFATARGAIAVMRDANPLYRAPRYSMDLLAYELRLAQFEGAPVADSDVQRLLDWHFIARGYTRHDDVMDSLWVGLVAQGRASYASSLLREYLCHFRREPKVCAFLLRTRTAGDPAWLMAAPTATPTVRST